MILFSIEGAPIDWFYASMTKEEIARVESIVNEQIQKDLPVTMEVMSLDDAKASGAVALYHIEGITPECPEAKAVFLRPNEPFTWASGIKSPIYCDNRYF